MARLMGAENLGGRIEKTWMHTGDHGQNQFTIEIVQDVAPILRRIEREAKNPTFKDFRLKADLPLTMIDDLSKISGKEWGVSVKDAFAEIMNQKSTRSKKALKLLTEGRDYRKLQTKHYV